MGKEAVRKERKDLNGIKQRSDESLPLSCYAQHHIDGVIAKLPENIAYVYRILGVFDDLRDYVLHHLKRDYRGEFDFEAYEFARRTALNAEKEYLVLLSRRNNSAIAPILFHNGELGCFLSYLYNKQERIQQLQNAPLFDLQVTVTSISECKYVAEFEDILDSAAGQTEKEAIDRLLEQNGRENDRLDRILDRINLDYRPTDFQKGRG